MGKKIGGEESEAEGHGLVIADDGSVYTTGYFKGEVDFDPGQNSFNVVSNDVDIFILKLDQNGNYEWANTISAAGDDRGLAITLDENNNVYTTGYFEGIADFDPGPDTFSLSSNSNAHAFILKLDLTGSFVWGGSLTGDAGYGAGFSIQIDNWDNIYTTGRFTSTIDFDPGAENYELTSPGYGDVFVQKMRTNCTVTPIINNGNTTITICFGDTISLSVEMPVDVSVASLSWNSGEITDSIVVAPDTTSTYTANVQYIQDSISCNNSVSVMVMTLENSDTTYLETTTCDSLSAGISAFVFPADNGCDSIVIKTTTLIPIPDVPIPPADLTIQENEPPFQLTVPEVPNATSYSWQVLPSVQILSGTNTNSITINWDDQISSGSVCVSALNDCGSSPADCMEITVDFIDGLDEIKSKGYSIFPNPADEVLHVVFEEEGRFEIVLLDILGRVVCMQAAESETMGLVTINLQQGVYWLKMVKGGEVFWEQVEVAKR